MLTTNIKLQKNLNIKAPRILYFQHTLPIQKAEITFTIMLQTQKNNATGK